MSNGMVVSALRTFSGVDLDLHFEQEANGVKLSAVSAYSYIIRSVFDDKCRKKMYAEIEYVIFFDTTTTKHAQPKFVQFLETHPAGVVLVVSHTNECEDYTADRYKVIRLCEYTEAGAIDDIVTPHGKVILEVEKITEA